MWSFAWVTAKRFCFFYLVLGYPTVDRLSETNHFSSFPPASTQQSVIIAHRWRHMLSLSACTCSNIETCWEVCFVQACYRTIFPADGLWLCFYNALCAVCSTCCRIRIKAVWLFVKRISAKSTKPKQWAPKVQMHLVWNVPLAYIRHGIHSLVGLTGRGYTQLQTDSCSHHRQAVIMLYCLFPSLPKDGACRRSLALSAWWLHLRHSDRSGPSLMWKL